MEVDTMTETETEVMMMTTAEALEEIDRISEIGFMAPNEQLDIEPQTNTTTTTTTTEEKRKTEAEKPTPLARRPEACNNCGTPETSLPNSKLMKCSSCLAVVYCGKDCQRAHWASHKERCKQISAYRNTGGNGTGSTSTGNGTSANATSITGPPSASVSASVSSSSSPKVANQCHHQHCHHCHQQQMNASIPKSLPPIVC